MAPLPTPATNRKPKITVSNQADITLREDHDLEFDRTLDLNFGDELGIGSQDYRAPSIGGDDTFDEDFELGLDLDLELDLGLMDDDGASVAGFTANGDREDSPAAIAAKQQRARNGQSPSRVAAIAAQARARSEALSETFSDAPSVELGRDAAGIRSDRDSVAPDLLPEAAQGMDLSVLKGPNSTFDDSAGGFHDFAPDADDLTMDLGGNDFDPLEDGQRSKSNIGTWRRLRAALTRSGSAPRAGSLAPSTAPGLKQTEQVESAAAAALDETLADAEAQVQFTPNTAARIADAAAVSSAQRKRKEAADNTATRPKPAKQRKQIVDAVTELADRSRVYGGESQSQQQSQNTQGAFSLATREERMAHGLLKEPKYLPATNIEMHFEEIYENPGKHFFPGMSAFAAHSSSTASKKETNGIFYAGPPGLSAELQALFKFKLGERGSILGARRVPNLTINGQTQASKGRDTSGKRDRSETAAADEDEGDIELGRDRQPSLAFEGPDMLDFGHQDDYGDDSHGFSLDLGNMSPGIDAHYAPPSREQTPSRLGSSPAGLDKSLNIDFDALDRGNNSILAVFDETPVSSRNARQSTPLATGRQSKNGYLSVPGTRASVITEANSQLSSQQSQSLLEESVQSAGDAASKGKTAGWSRNTVKAIKILEHELGPAPHSEEEDTETNVHAKTVSFEGLASKVRY